MKTVAKKVSTGEEPVNPASFSLVDKTDRGVLGEGRNYYMGFGFAKREGSTLTMVSPISPCKDYLNDVIWTERSNKNVSAHGLSYSRKDLFKDRKFGYLVVAILNNKYSSTPYKDYDRDLKRLNTEFKRIEELLRNIEDLLKLDQKTRVFKLEDNRVMLKVPMFWCESTYGISLYTLLARIALFYEGGDPMNFLETFTAFQADSYLVKGAVPKLKQMIEGNRPKQDFTQNLDNYTIHNMGIIGYQF